MGDDVIRVFVDMLDVTENETICCVVAADGTHVIVPVDDYEFLVKVYEMETE